MKTIQDINNFISPLMQKQYNLLGDNLAMFLAQCHHESQGFNVLIENLNYKSIDRLVAIFPKYFNIDNAHKYIDNPVAIANVVYGGRMGNNNSADGYMFRGAGYLMLTGRDNYTAFSNSLNLYGTLLGAESIAENHELSLLSALWIWHTLKLADCDIETCTKRLNGGLNGINDRIKLFNYYKGIIA